MNPSKLRRRLQVQQLAEGNDLDGYPEDDWQTLREVYAAIRPLSGREYTAAQQQQEATTHVITTRHFEGATSAMRLVDGNRVFHPEAVLNFEERNRWLEWRCVEGGL